MKNTKSVIITGMLATLTFVAVVFSYTYVVYANEYVDAFPNMWYVNGEIVEISRTNFVDTNGNPLSRMGLIPHEEYGNLFLTTEIVFIDEFGYEETKRMFACASALMSARSASGSGTHRVEIDRLLNLGHSNVIETRWAQGHFTYHQGNNTVTVSNAIGGVTDVPNMRITNRSTTTSSGTTWLGLGVFWRQVDFSFTSTNAIGGSRDLSVSARVRADGNRS
jgi:hypothetical protein